MSEYKLKFELVPAGRWGDNLRSILSKQAWEFLKNDARLRANGRCAVCGKKTNRLDAHERWSYNLDTRVQKLEDIVAVCKDCHSVMHIGRTQLVGDEERAEKHFMKVNGCTYAEYRQALGKANEDNIKLNEVGEWTMDLTYLQRYVTDEEK